MSGRVVHFEIPFDDGAFEAVTCQFGLMFFEDRVKALSEMARVTQPGGRLVVATWDSLERTPGYRAVVGLLERLFGAAVADGLRAPFVLGDPDDLRDLFKMAGLAAPKIETVTGAARFPSIEAWVRTDIKGWTLADVLDDAQYAQLQKEAQQELKPFVQPDGSVFFESPAHIVTVVKA